MTMVTDFTTLLPSLKIPVLAIATWINRHLIERKHQPEKENVVFGYIFMIEAHALICTIK